MFKGKSIEERQADYVYAAQIIGNRTAQQRHADRIETQRKVAKVQAARWKKN